MGNTIFEHSNILISPFRVEAKNASALFLFICKEILKYSQLLESAVIEVSTYFVKMKENTKGVYRWNLKK